MSAIQKLLAVMQQLRNPQGGCPWDLAQDFKSVAPYTLEEAYEVADAIGRDDLDGLREELGDLLFQVVFHAQMAAELGEFDFDDVVTAITDKMIRRHPHVFGDAVVESVAAQSLAWDELKAKEKSATRDPSDSLMDGVPTNLPAVLQAEKVQRRASRVGLDWPESSAVFAKLREELDELEEAARAPSDRDRHEDELGDVLFSCINLARHLNIAPEGALRRSTDKFQSRVRRMEDMARQEAGTLTQMSDQDLDRLWCLAKAKSEK